MTSARLPIRTKLAFGVGSAAEAGNMIAFNAFATLFYTQVMGLSGTLCGIAILIALCVDAVSDPVIGSLSDRMRSRWGRRHPFMFLSALPTGLCYALVFSPPTGLGEYGLFAWLTAFTLFFRQAQSLYHVPHLALGAEITNDYRERSIVMAYNALFAMIGGSAAFFFTWTWFAKAPGGQTVRENFAVMGYGIGICAVVLIFASAWFTRDRIPTLRQPVGETPPFSILELFREIGSCMRNSNYLNLLLGLIFLSVTLGTRETLQSHISLYFWELPADKIRVFGLASPPAFIIMFLLTSWLHSRFEKRSSLLASVVLMIVASAMPLGMRVLGMLPPPGSPKLIPALFVFVFIFYAGVALFLITILSALSDVTDEYELETGKRQEGVFFASRTFFSQLTNGLGHVVAGLAIDLIGFPTKAVPGTIEPTILWQLAFVEGPLNAIPAALALVFYARYDIDKKRHAQIQAELRSRNAGATVGTAESTPAPVLATASSELA